MRSKRNWVSKRIWIEELDVHGIIYNVSFIVEAEIVETGIGHFEFWGHKGYDLQFGIEEFTIEDIEYTIYDDFGYSPYTEEEIIKTIYDSESICQYIIEELEDYDDKYYN